MKFTLSTILAATACTNLTLSANVVFYNTHNCAAGTAKFACVFLSREQCCDPRGSFNSVEFQALGSDNVQLRSYNGGACSRRTAISASSGRNTACFVREPPYTGAGYGRFGRKREVEDGSKEECVRPQELTFGDGTMFDLTSLSDEGYDVIANLKPENPSDIPEQFQQLKVIA